MSERDIFIAALQKDDPAQRQAYLEEALSLIHISEPTRRS